MKFNKHLPKWRKEFLENEYKEYCKVTYMTQKERRALREWVKDGNSVYENSMGAWADGQIPVEFLSIYRDEEYIKQHTKGMSPEDTKKFALDYYGWSDDNSTESTAFYNTNDDEFYQLYKITDADEDLPFK